MGFLAKAVFGCALKGPTVSLQDAVVAMAKNRSVASLQNGVADYLEKKVRKVDSALIESIIGNGRASKGLEAFRERLNLGSAKSCLV
jgi:hypothetical protein